MNPVDRRASELSLTHRLLGWEACEHPERRPDQYTMFANGCAGCRIALTAALLNEPPADAFQGWWQYRQPLADKFGIDLTQPRHHRGKIANQEDQ